MGCSYAKRRIPYWLGPSSKKSNRNEARRQGKPMTAMPAPPPKKVCSENVMDDYFAMAMKECGKEVP
jgi:hypothetical protein